MLRKANSKAEDWESGYFSTPKGEWAKLTDAKLMYVVEESRLFLQALWDSYGRLTQKASFLLGVIIGIVTLIFTEMISRQDYWNDLQWWNKVLLALYLLFLIALGFRLLKYQLPILSHAAGTQPLDLLKKESMNCDFEEMAIRRLELYQDSIDHNRRQNIELSRTLKYSYLFMLGYPTAVTWIYIILLVYSSVSQH